jgi:hypothetical protein
MTTEGSTPTMREVVEQRVSELKTELQKGQQMLAELEARESELRQTVLRISGALQVLEELLAAPVTPPPNGTRPAPPAEALAAEALAAEALAAAAS